MATPVLDYPRTWGAALALIVLIVTLLLAFMHLIDVPVALVVAAICSTRL